MANQKCAVIISCFPGVGKTALHELNHDGSSVNPEGKYTIYDVETMAQDAESDEYWQIVETLAQEEDAVVLITASGDSHRGLLSRGWRFVCVHPGVDIKDVYMRQYFDRAGIDRTWISLYRYWEEKLEELEVGSGDACTDCELAAGEDLEDVLPYILAGVEEGAFLRVLTGGMCGWINDIKPNVTNHIFLKNIHNITTIRQHRIETI